MISNNETKQEYITFNKIYIPTEYYNENYKYYISNDEITIITDNNCYTNYNTQYCDAYRYNEKYNIITQSYSTNSNPNNNYRLSFTSLTDDINYNDRITDYYYKNYGILFLIIITALIMFKTLKGS